MYKTPTSWDPICVASLIRCASPPESDLEPRFKLRYVRPTSTRKAMRARISFTTSSPICNCLAESFASIFSNQSARSEISRLASSAIFLSFILKYKASFFNREPSHSGQSTLSMYSLAHLRKEVESLFLKVVSIKLATPSKSILKSRVIPKALDSLENFSFPPYKIISNASFGILLIGSLRLKSKRSAISSS